MPNNQKSARSTAATGKSFEGFTDEERAAMKEHAQELSAAARRSPRAAKTGRRPDRDSNAGPTA